MSSSSNSNLPINLRSGRVVRRESRERRPRRIPRTGSAPPIPGTHDSPKISPPRRVEMAEQIEGAVPPIEEELPLSHYSNPSIVSTPSCIVHPHPELAFEIKHSMLSILPSFHGAPRERPYDHIIDFETICSTLNRG